MLKTPKSALKGTRIDVENWEKLRYREGICKMGMDMGIHPTPSTPTPSIWTFRTNLLLTSGNF